MKPRATAFASRSWSGLLAQLIQCVAGETADAPVVHQRRAEATIETNRRLVPVEHGPLHATPAAIDRQPREVLEQLAAHAAPALVLVDVQIFQVESRPSEERREIREEQGEPYCRSIALRERDFRHRPRAEQMRPQQIFCRDDLVLELLVLREP